MELTQFTNCTVLRGGSIKEEDLWVLVLKSISAFCPALFIICNSMTFHCFGSDSFWNAIQILNYGLQAASLFLVSVML